MYDYTVIENQQLTPSTILVTLKRDADSRLFAFQSGQYAALSLTTKRGRPTPARCFSIVSSPTEPDILQFSTRPRGHFTKAMSRLTSGRPVRVMGPFGHFVVDAERDDQLVFIAGGIGITPFISMIRFATVTAKNQKITLIYSNQSQTDVPFAEELQQLEKENPNFTVIFVIGSGPTTSFHSRFVPRGRITPEVLEAAVFGIFDNKSYFICGPAPFMNAMVKTLLAKGAKADRVATEAFSQGSKQKTDKLRIFPLNIYIVGSLGVIMSSFIVMILDLLKTLPPASYLGPSATIVTQKTLTNSRQNDLDQLVNALPLTPSSAPVTAAVTKSNEAVTAAAAATAQATQTAQTATPTTVVATKAPAPAPTPAPAPVQTCTTTQSGVTTCI